MTSRSLSASLRGPTLGLIGIAVVHLTSCRESRAEEIEYGRAGVFRYFVTDHVRRSGLGHVFGQDTGFRIESSPDTVRDRAGDYLAKVAQWLDAGTLIVWSLTQSAPRRTSTSRREPNDCCRDDELDGEAVLPGFSCPLADVLR